MPKMQEQFSAMPMDGWYPENAGALFGVGAAAVYRNHKSNSRSGSTF